jgi:hypothetical protein
MAKKIKLELTERQFQAFKNITDTISGMLGVGTDFDYLGKEVALIDRMLKKNGYKRDFE